MRLLLLTLLLLVLLIISPFPSSSTTGCDGASNCYVRSGATGSNTGENWSDAYADLPASLSRGVTYWVAAGTYPPHSFNDPDSGPGTPPITIKAPTIDQHGTNTGWSLSYVGQALWQCTSACGPIWDVSQENYIIFDGSYATPLAAYSSLATYGYGFKLQTNGYGGNGNTGNGCTACGIIQGGEGWIKYPRSGTYDHDVTVKYVEIAGNHQTSDTGVVDSGVDFEGGSYNLYFGHMYVHDASLEFSMYGNHQGHFRFGSGNNITVEYTYMTRDYTDQGSGKGPHGQACACGEGLTNFTWRYNIITDMVGTSTGIATASGGGYNTGNGNGGPWYIYGNLWFADNPDWCAAGDGTLSIFDFSMTAGDLWFVNNTIANNGYPYCSVSGGASATDEVTYGIGIGYKTPMAGWYEQNNLWYAADLTTTNGSDIIQNGLTEGGTQGGKATWSKATVHGYDAYFRSPNTGANDNDPNKQVSPINPFANISATNFNLATDTAPGVTLTNIGTNWNGTADVPNTFDTDMNGTRRTSWTRGALQFTGSPTRTP